MMKTIVVLLMGAVLTDITAAQTYQGPAAGSVPGGASITTDNFQADGFGEFPGPKAQRAFNKVKYPPLPPPAVMPEPTGPEGSNLITYGEALTGPPPIVLNSFPGIPQTNSIPPDPHCAVGPNHVMGVVNTSFRISTKDGVTLKTIPANSWFQNVLTGADPFDPKVHYDHFAGRWIMVWLHLNVSGQVGYYLLSVSDDDNPLGTWYNWALPSHVNGSTFSSNWADYQGVGFDNQAIYFTSNQWGFSPMSFHYAKIRIIGKAQLYANTGGAVSWSDIWNLSLPGSGFSAYGIRPTIIHSLPNEYYFLVVPNFTFGTYFSLYRLTNPLTSPALSGVNVSVTGWSIAPDASQLGGGSLPIDGGGSQLRHEPVYMDSSVWAAHAVANGGYSSVRYVRISTLTNSAVEDGALGEQGYWHIWPALAVDKDKNVAITFSRSAIDEYVGAFFSWRLGTDPAGWLRPAFTIQEGRANYVKDFGTGRNRWGDYMGIKIDPTDRNNFWMFTEYAETPANTWAVRWMSARLVPFDGSRINSALTEKDFGPVEANFSSDTTLVVLYNIGNSDLTITSVTVSQPPYHLLGLPAFPRTLSTYDSLAFRIHFLPTAHGTVHDTIRIASNDPTNPLLRIPLTGRGIVLGTAQVGVAYAGSVAPVSQLFSIHPASGVPTSIGALGVPGIEGLAIRPSTKELYGIYNPTTTSTTLYRLSTLHGDALPVTTIPLGNMKAIAFSNVGDTLYAATTAGRLYRITITTGDTVFVGATAGVNYASLSMHPQTGMLWAGVRPPLSNRDRIYTVDPATGVATLVGSTGFANQITNGLAFSNEGVLYGLTGVGGQINNLITINTQTGAGTLVGATGLTNLAGLALRPDSGVTSVRLDDRQIPSTFVLSQNYPNPFNPTTQIRYGVPRQSHVILTVFNSVGQEVARLVDGVQSAGYYETIWDGTNHSGIAVASGIYFCKLEAFSENAQPFTESRKMLFLK